ncbi:MAG: fructosamine kinase family protein [Sulfuricellaceae bacterium]|nr:fructosamine kinase family protein [Sulfuricellaceae bacterium]
MQRLHSDTDWQSISVHISTQTGTPFKIASICPVSGGCINRAFRVDGGGKRYFVKINEAGYLPIFEAEADGLREIQASRSLRVPVPAGTGLAGTHAFLLLEWIETGDSSRAGWEKMAQNLAAMHRHVETSFGWKRDNTIGATPQRRSTISTMF